MTAAEVLTPFIATGVGAPALVLLLLGLAALLQRRLPEHFVGPVVSVAMLTSLICFVAAAPPLLAMGESRVVIAFGSWFAVGQAAFAMELLIDPISVGFAVLTVLIGGVVSAFSHRYMHREAGYQRFFVLLVTFVVGMLLVVLAGSIEVLFAGWEMVGIGSALLVAFFHDRPLPVRNALRVFTIYRLGDAAMLAAAILVHHLMGSGSLSALFGEGGGDAVSGTAATVVGLLLVAAAAVKCAQLPFSGWLPRAMEGPTPSSAIFYGALSVHAGAYLLLRALPLLRESVVAMVALALLGITTSVFATLVGRAQTDIKSTLAFASMTQVGVILVEIALGLVWLAALHIVGHSLLRLLQFLRAPSLLHDFHLVESAVGGHVARTGVHLERMFSPGLQRRLYRFALERGGLDDWLDGWFVEPFVRLCRAADRLERRWCGWVAGADVSGVASSSGSEEGKPDA